MTSYAKSFHLIWRMGVEITDGFHQIDSLIESSSCTYFRIDQTPPLHELHTLWLQIFFMYNLNICTCIWFAALRRKSYSSLVIRDEEWMQYVRTNGVTKGKGNQMSYQKIICNMPLAKFTRTLLINGDGGITLHIHTYTTFACIF